MAVEPYKDSAYFYTCSLELAKQHLRGIPGWRWEKGQVIVPCNMLDFLPQQEETWDEKCARIRRASKIIDDDVAAFDARTLGWKLRAYQHGGRILIATRRGTLLADAPRLGKTAQIVSAAASAPLEQLFVVGPLMTRAVWLTWFNKMFPSGKRVIALKGRKQDISKIKNADIVFANYDIISNWQNTVSPPGMVVFDEAHLLSNHRTKRYAAAQLLATQAKKVVCATGTPLWNKPAQLYNILNLVEPGGWGTRYQFSKRYANGHRGEFGFEASGTSNEDELKIRLNAVMLRRTWEDVRSELPKITRNIELIELDPADRVKLDIQLELGRKDTKTIIGDMARMRRAFALEHKVEHSVDLAAQYLDNFESVVIWTWHVDVAHDIKTRLIGRGHHAELIIGETSDKDGVLENWRSRHCSALVMSLAVGQTGIDLSHAAHAIFAEIDWTPAVMSQAEMRTYSPDRPGSITYVMTDHPLEVGIVKGILAKCRAAEKIGAPAADVGMDFLYQIVSEDEFLFDEESTDSLLTDLFEETIDDGEVW